MGGGKVKRSNGYKIDDFVTSPSDEEADSSNVGGSIGYETSDSEKKLDHMAMKSEKAFPSTTKPNGMSNRRVLTTSDLVAMDQEGRSGKSKAKKEASRVHTPIKAKFENAADDEDVNDMIGAGTDSDYDESDISAFSTYSEPDDSDFEDDQPKNKSKRGGKNFTSAPSKAEASPPGVKRTRDEFERDVSNGERFNTFQDSPARNRTAGEMLKNLATDFGMESRRANQGVKMRKTVDDQDAM